MSLTITKYHGTIPSPKIVNPIEVVNQAQQAGNPNATIAIAVTRPFLKIDQTGLIYDTQPAAKPVDFRFRSGVLLLTLRQTIHISSSLSACEQGIWKKHELEHVKDNQQLMSIIDGSIRNHPQLMNIFFWPVWHPISQFNNIQQTIQNVVSDIFIKLVTEAIKKRDTFEEYSKINQEIIKKCPGKFVHEVVTGETLFRLSLFYYGNSRYWPSIYTENKNTIGKNPDRILPGQNLIIPKNPTIIEDYFKLLLSKLNF